MVHSPFRTLRPSFLGTSCSISELRHEEESSPRERARRPPRKLTHPQPSAKENIVGLLSFLYFLSLRVRVHLGLLALDLGMVTFQQQQQKFNMTQSDGLGIPVDKEDDSYNEQFKMCVPNKQFFFIFFQFRLMFTLNFTRYKKYVIMVPN